MQTLRPGERHAQSPQHVHNEQTSEPKSLAESSRLTPPELTPLL